MFDTFQRYIPLFQGYLRADNRQQYVQNLSDPTERKIIKVLVEEIKNVREYEKELREIRINSVLERDLMTLKLTNHLQNAQEMKDDDIVNEIKKQFANNRYDYPRPQTMAANDPAQQKQDLTPTNLTVQENLQAYLNQKLNQKPYFIRSLNDYGISKVSKKVLLGLPLIQKEYLLDKCGIIYHFEQDFIANFLVEYEKQKRKANANFRLTSKILQNLTKLQINHLSKVDKKMFENQDYIQLWFNLNYSERITKHVEDSQSFTKVEHMNKREQFEKIIQELAGMNHNIIRSYINKFKTEIMYIDLIVEDPSIERLIQFLKTNFQSVLRINELTYQFRNQTTQRIQNDAATRFEAKMRYTLDVEKKSVDELVEEYLSKLFRNDKGKQEQYIDQLSTFINRGYLTKLNAKASLSRGDKVENIHHFLENQELQKLKEQKSIKLHSTNKKSFRPKDEVELQVSIKNVQRIDVKIYELNLQKHLLTQQYQIDDEINLSFVKPAVEYIYNNEAAKSNPFTVVNTSLRIDTDHIPKKMGVFIVDLQGDTVTSRAVIRKGAILCVESYTEAGQQFSFHDQQGRPLTPKEGLKVWVNGKPRTLKENKNYFFVDYVQKNEWIKIVASVGSYAESFEKELKAEQYKFQVGYIYNNESFIVGKKAKIGLHGRLTMNNYSMSLQLLRNIKVKVTVTNNQQISTFYSFNIDKWTDRQDQFVQFPIQSYTSRINIAVQAKIMLQTKKETNISHSKQIRIDLSEESQNFIDIYLQKDRKDNYVLNLLGLNGQIIANSDVVLTYSISGVEEAEKAKVKTDSHGKVHLGKLSIVKELTAEINCYKANIQRAWLLDQTELGVNYTNVIHVKVGQEITLPVDPSWAKEDYVLLRTFDKYYAEDISNQIKFQHNKIVLPLIKKEGYYILKILPVDKVIEIITIKDYKWEGDTDQNQKVYDQKYGKIYDINRNLYQNVNILDVKEERLEHTTKVQVALNLHGLKGQKQKKIRVHAFATNFISNELQEAFKPENFNVQPQLNQYYMRFKSSAYYSNKTLSDEGAYVWKRQKQTQRIIGNNLQKPGIFLKRTLVRQTNQENEDLNQSDRYIQECAMTSVDPNLRQRVNARKDKKAKPLPKLNYLNSHNNFLALSGHVQNNLNGQTVTFEVPNNYNNVQLLILTPSTAIKKNISLGNTQFRKNKDLRHVGMTDSQKTKGWTMSREVYQLQSGKQMTINRNSLWRTVTLSDIYEFANAKRISLYDWSSHLLNWNNYDLKKKTQIYDKETCHQLNAFLYFQDRKFFDNVVRPFITNKINKTFVDLCLLGDIHVKQYATIDKLSRLNAFEKVLLVHSLMNQKQIQTAQKITKMLTLQQESIKKNYEEFKNNFDTIINSKAQPEKRQERQRAVYLELDGGFGRMGGLREMRERSSDIRLMSYQQQQCEDYLGERNMRMAQKREFVPVQSTKQYTERTYYNVKNYKNEAPYLIASSTFWAKLAEHLLTGKQNSFLSKEFMSLSSGIQFILAASFISSESSANFDLEVVGENYKITAKSPMLLYVKQVKELQYASKFGVQINQRFIDPQNMHRYEDGLRVEAQVEEFVVKKPYIAQTVVTNTSGTPLQLQILIDIPRGTIPLQSHEYTEIKNVVLRQYSSLEFKRIFYAPEEGQYRIYPSNACRGSTIIAKAEPKSDIVMKKYLTINKFQSFDDILRSGDKQKIIDFLKNKNIFDRNTFDPSSILWMLKDKQFYSSVVSILRERRYFNSEIWNFAFYHNDLKTIKQVMRFRNPDRLTLQPAIFEYFPYYSSRTHQFANQTKSTIRNVQFKDSYLKFLVSSVVGIQDRATFGVSFAYYLILQDRLKEADALLKKFVKQFPESHQIQVDYMRCFLDMSLNAPNFEVARQIMNKYKEYPIQSWKKLFDEVRKSLQAEDQDFSEDNEFKRAEEFHTQVIQETGQFKIIQPADTTILVQFFEINLEVFFSDFPFYDYKTFTAVKPSCFKEYPASSETKEIIIKRKDYPNIRDATVEITQAKEGLPPKKVATFDWTNSELKVKVSENAGTLQVFINKKKYPGAYVKVFSKKKYSDQFYRDGYTDMTGSFRYAMSDLEDITEFSILVSTDKGGVIQKVKPPSKLSSY